MPTVFVHGVPETPVIWDSLIEALGVDDPVCLRLPGFGSPLPEGFEPTMGRYAGWLQAELAALDGPIDLVTHDWGALLSIRVNAAHPSLARSWVTDAGNIDASFEWHDTARSWQTPGEGEAFMDGVTALPEPDRADLLAGLGIEASIAAKLSPEVDETMGAAILALYRSATEIGTEWGPGIDDIVVPTLAIQAMLDPFGSAAASDAYAARTGAARVPIAEAGHWWMTTHPTEAAAAINEFWSSLD